MVRQSTAVLLYKKTDISLENRLRWQRWCTRTLNWTVLENGSCLLFSDEPRFSLAYCDGVGNLVNLYENMNAHNYVRTLSENLHDFVENIFGKNYPFVFQHDNATAHTAQLESCLSREMIWFEICTIPAWTLRCHICATFTTPFPKSKGSYYGAGLPNKIVINKVFCKKDNIWICLTFPERSSF